MPNPTLPVAAVAALLLLAAAALAGPRPLAAQPAPARGGEGAEPTVLELTEAARREVPQDEMLATLTAHAEAADAGAAQNTVNRMMAAAVEAARKTAGVRHASGGYSVSQRQERENEPLVWVAEQQLNLTSGDGSALLRLVGDLQGAGLVVQDLRWALAAATRRNVERQLLAEALDALQRTARTAADGLGLRVAGWRRVSLAPDGPPIGPVFRARMAAPMQAEMAEPVAAAGTSEVVVNVSAEALLTPGR